MCYERTACAFIAHEHHRLVRCDSALGRTASSTQQEPVNWEHGSMRRKLSQQINRQVSMQRLLTVRRDRIQPGAASSGICRSDRCRFFELEQSPRWAATSHPSPTSHAPSRIPLRQSGASAASQPPQVSDLNEVFSRVRMLDARVREVLQSNGDFVLVTNPESSPQGQMISKVESGAERFVAASVDRRQHIGSYSDLGKPWRAVRWLCPSQNRCDADLADPGGT